MALPGSGGIALRQGDILSFVCKSEQGDFRTTFAYQSVSDSWTWAMDNQDKGKLVPFARVTLMRK